MHKREKILPKKKSYSQLIETLFSVTIIFIFIAAVLLISGCAPEIAKEVSENKEKVSGNDEKISGSEPVLSSADKLDSGAVPITSANSKTTAASEIVDASAESEKNGLADTTMINETSKPDTATSVTPEPNPISNDSATLAQLSPIVPSIPTPKLNEFNMPDEKKKEFVTEFDVLQCSTKTYFTDSSVREMIDWYYAELPYKVAFKSVFNPEKRPEIEIGTLVLKKDTKGIYISVQPADTIPVATGKTMVIYVECPWSLLKPVVGDVSGPLSGGKDIDWTEAFSAGDPVGDFWLGDGSPPAIINYPATDLVKFYIKNDEAYLYVKYELAGVIPNLPNKQDSDTVRILSYFMLIDKDKNAGMKLLYPGADLALDSWFGSPKEANNKMYALINYFFYDSAGEEELGAANEAELVAGGVGSNFVTTRYKLADLGIKRGSTIYIFPVIEAESDSYHHFTRDVYEKDVEWTAVEIK